MFSLAFDESSDTTDTAQMLVFICGVTESLSVHEDLYFIYFYLFLFLLTINLKLIKVHVEIKIVNKEAATKRSTLLHAPCTDVEHGRRTFEQSDVMLIRKGKRKEDN